MPDEAPVTMMVFDCALCGSDMPGRLPIARKTSHIRRAETILRESDAKAGRGAAGALGRARPFQHRRRLGDGEPSGYLCPDGAVPVPDLRHDAGELSRRASF